MTKTKLLITAFVSVLFFTKANAQVDTSRFDLGRMQLRKDFTQSVTVKGEDLQKMPFTNLAEAINVWFNGAYTTAINMVYVIDGNLVNDVNAYSVYDIDQVTLIQNALAQVTGASQQQQIVVITTKRHRTKGSGITVADQVNLSGVYTNNISRGTTGGYETGLKSTTTIAHQVYVSAYKNTGNVEFGASADYLGDELPQIKETTSNTDYRLGRLRLNGYFDAKFGNSVLDVTAGYAPQTIKDIYTENTQTINQTLDDKDNQHIFNATVKLVTHILPGLTNDLHADYNNFGDNVNGTTNNIYPVNTTSQKLIDGGANHNHTILAYDNLSYTAKFGDWSLEPAINLSFRSLRDSSGTNYATYGPNGELEQAGSSYIAFKSHMLLLTPSVSLYYKNYFGVTGGLLYNIVNKSGLGGDIKKRAFPFISASLDVAQLINPASAISLKVYGAYAMADPTVDNSNVLSDLNVTNSTVQIPYENAPIGYQTMPFTGYSGFYYAEFNSGLLNTTKTFNSVTTGITVAPAKGGLTFSYFFNRYNYLTEAYIYVPGYLGVTDQISFDMGVVSVQHRFGIDYTVNNNSAFSWHTGINATMIKQTYANVYAGQPLDVANTSNGANEWTGGWVNRFNYRSFFAGADLLYLLHETAYIESTSGTFTATKINSFSLQNLYAGYRLKVAGKNLELFANGRNLFQNKKETITNGRYYYGLGFKLLL